MNNINKKQAVMPGIGGNRKPSQYIEQRTHEIAN